MTDASGRHCRRSQAPKPTPKTIASAANCPDEAARGEKKAFEFPVLYLIDVTSSDRHVVKPWLSTKLNFSPPVAEIHTPGAAFLSGRIDDLDGRPVAALVYRQGAHVVTSFLWPADGRDSGPALADERGFHVAHWVHAGMNHWVISDLNRREFEACVAAMRSSEAGF